MNTEFAKQWLAAFGSSPEEAAALYAEQFQFADVPLEQHIRNDKAMLIRAFAPFANKDPANGMGIHSFELVEYIGDANSGAVLWKWTAMHAEAFFGLPTQRANVETTGMSFHVYKDGRISREVVHWDQIHPLQRLGYPIQIPHFWEAA